ncbi:MAG: RsiV family protein [Paludibacteraceae bacterium]|nr:RsiV family protein [Paludibacteraceae bacterium]
MTNNIFKNILLTSMSAALCCCSVEKKGETTTADSGFATSVLAFDTVGHINADEANPQFKYAYNLTLPNEGQSLCADSIRLSMIAEATDLRTDDITAARKKKIMSLAVVSEEDAAAYKELFPAAEMPCVYECESGKVFENSDIYNSYFKAYSYMGGAHPYSYTDFKIWDKANSKRLSHDDIFVSDSESKLTNMILDSLCKMMDVNGHDNLIDAGILEVKDVAPNNSMIVYTDFLSFNYKPYEIAAYAVGPIEVKISFVDLKPLMRTDSPLYKLTE